MPSRSVSIDGDRPRKRVRKGTHSCWECKRRKVRCLFPVEGDTICAECHTRGTKCQKQKFADEDGPSAAPKSIPDRVRWLESVVESVLERLDQPGTRGGTSYNDLTPSSMLSNSNENVPILSLFKNDVLGQCQSDEEIQQTTRNRLERDFSPTSGPLLSKNERIFKILSTLIPSQQQLKAIFESSGDWWSVWQLSYPGICNEVGASSLHDFTSQTLAEGRPTAIANVLLSISISIQQLPPTFDHGVFETSFSGKDLMEKCVSMVNNLVLSDDELAASIEGLECLALAGKLYLNAGKPRRAWLNFRRALSMAEIIGLHRNSTRSNFGSDGISISRKNSVWWQIYQADRLLSLLLGFSHGLNDAFCDLETCEETTEATFLRKVARIASRVADRNQAVSAPSFALTQELEEDLESLVKQMPQSWWRLPTVTVDVDSASLLGRVIPQFWHYQVAVLLHLPFMLRAGTEPKFAYNKQLCLQASREMIQRYLFLRQNATQFFRACTMVDFQAFIAAVVLQLNLLRHIQNKYSQEDQERNAVDWAFVHSINQELASSKTHNAAAAQAFAVLETLEAVSRNQGPTGNRFKLNIPYFGTICVEGGANLCKSIRGCQDESSPASKEAQNQSPVTKLHNDMYMPATAEISISPDAVADWPQISYISSLYAGNETNSQIPVEAWPILGDFDIQYDNSRIDDLNGTWDWFMDSNYPIV